MKILIYCLLVWFAMQILFVAWLTVVGYFRARADRLKNAANADDRTRTRPIPFGTRAAMEKILSQRLDE